MKIMLDHPILARFAPLLRKEAGDGHEWLLATKSDRDSDRDSDTARTRAEIAEVEVFIGARMSEAVAAAATKLRLVQVAGAGYDGIPIHALPDTVAVANTFHHGKSIAEHVLMCTLMLSRQVMATDRALRTGRWDNVAVQPDRPLAETLSGKRIGIIGLGEIGTEVARLCGALGMRVRAVRRNPATPLPADVHVDWVRGADDLPMLLADADFVVVTTPLTPGTTGLIGPAELAAMGPDTALINVARGPVVAEDALYEALRERRIRAAALDVWWAAPPAPPSRLPFGELDNVIMTPHNSGHTRETFEERAREIAANIVRLERGEPLTNLLTRR
jgi:phosphoglycerate dehydrogenase-like enzyme